MRALGVDEQFYNWSDTEKNDMISIKAESKMLKSHNYVAEQ